MRHSSASSGNAWTGLITAHPVASLLLVVMATACIAKVILSALNLFQSLGV